MRSVSERALVDFTLRSVGMLEAPSGRELSNASETEGECVHRHAPRRNSEARMLFVSYSPTQSLVCHLSPGERLTASLSAEQIP